MKLPLPANTFQTLVLTEEEIHATEMVAEAIVRKTMQEYHELLTVHNGVVDEKRWKKIKKQADVRVHMERRASLSSSYPSADDSESGEIQTKASMLTFGSIPGKLEDVMYGILCPTTEDMQLKTAYTEDGLADWGVLAAIIKPTEADPFRALSIKWNVSAPPLPMSAVVRTRDSLYIESSGFAITTSGERVGYRMDHTVNLPAIPELTELNIVRVKFSACEFFRQRGNNCVEVYSHILFNPMGSGSTTVASRTLADVPIRAFKHVQCAEMKKLTRMLRSVRRNQSPSLTSLESSGYSWASSAESIPPSLPPPDTCGLCLQKMSSGFPFSSTKVKQCQICYACVCPRCCIEKTMYSHTEIKKQLKNESVPFCTRCMFTAASASSSKFAVLDALQSEEEFVDYRDALQ